MSQMLKSSGAMGLATLSSRVLGMVREMVYAAFMGDGAVAGAFKFAYSIPNLFRRLLGEGALTAAFIPIFKETEQHRGEAEMWRTANVVISALVIAATAVVVLALIGVSLALLLPGLRPETRLMLELLRIMFPYMILVCLAAVLMGMLNSRGFFFIPAMGATMLNVVMILTVIGLAPRFGSTPEEQIYALAIGVLLAGIAQTLFQIPTLRREGFRFQWIPPWTDPVVREVVRKMIPGTLGVAAFQLNVLVTQGLAYRLDPTINASFDYAVRLMELPQGVFGISLATYLLPTLSGLAAKQDYRSFRHTLTSGLGHLWFINLLASVLLLVLAEPVVRLIFQRGTFTDWSTQRTCLALTYLAPGLVFFSTVNVLARAFYALGDTETPMRISVFCLLINLVFAFWLVDGFRQGGLGLANTLSSILNVALLLYALKRKLRRLDLIRLAHPLRTLAPAAFASGLVAWILLRTWRIHLGHSTLLTRAGEVFVPALAAVALYAGICLWLKVESLNEVLGMLRRPSNTGKK